MCSRCPLLIYIHTFCIIIICKRLYIAVGVCVWGVWMTVFAQGEFLYLGLVII